MRVLIVEDDEVIASTMSRGLTLNGYVVEHVPTAWTTNSGHGNDRLSSAHVCCQTLHQGVECDLAAGAVAQVFMHRDPGVEFKFEFVRQHANEVRVVPGERHLADTDAAAGTHERELAHVAVGAY